MSAALSLLQKYNINIMLLAKHSHYMLNSNAFFGLEKIYRVVQLISQNM